MVTIKPEYCIRTGANGDPLTVLTIKLASGAVFMAEEFWENYKNRPEPDRTKEEKAEIARRRKNIVKLYDEPIGVIFDMIIAHGRKPSTASRYAGEVGKLALWGCDRVSGEFVPEDIAAFLKHRVKQSRKESEKRYGKGNSRDSEGRGVWRSAVYALTYVLDTMLGMDLCGLLPIPDHPEPIPPASDETVEKLSNDESLSLRDRLMLIMVNVLGLRPGLAVKVTWHDFASDFSYVNICTGYTSDGMAKIRRIEIPPQYRSMLRKASQDAAGCHFLLHQLGDDPNPAKAASIRTLQYRLERIARHCGIEEHLTFTALQKAEPCRHERAA